MQKIQQKSFRSTIFMTKLFLEDVESIIRILQSNNLEVEIVDEENKYDSISDLIDNKGANPKNISINAKAKDSLFEYVFIRLTDLSSSVNVNGGPERLLIGYEIEKLFKKRQRSKIYYFINSYGATINIIIHIVLAISSYIYHTYYKKDEFELLYWIPLIVFWILVLIYCELNPMSNSKIHLEKKHEVNFYKNNKDKILLGIIMAVIGALITIIVTKITD